MGEKIWWKSRGVWGGVVAMLAGIAAALGYSLSEGVQADIVELILGIAGVAGGGLAVWGRIKAETKIAGTGGTGGASGLKILLLLAVPALLLVGCISGCLGVRMNTDPGTETALVADPEVVAQLPGVVEALADVAMTAPVDAETRKQLKEYVEMGKEAAATISSAVSSDTDTLTKLVDVVRGVASIVDKSTADAGTKTQVSNYVAWAVLGVRMASILGAAS